MSFDRIRSDLSNMDAKLSGGGQITAAELFNMIRDLCEDVRTETGVPVEKNPAGDTAQLLQQLPWMGRLISRQFRQIENQVMDNRRQAELEDKMRELDYLAEQLELQAGETAVLEDKRKALRSRYAALEAGANKKLALQTECDQLEEKVRIASEITLPQLQERLTQLQAEQDSVTARLEQLRQAQQQTQEECQAADDQCAQIDQSMELLLLRKEDLTRTRDRKSRELEQLRQVMSQLDSECAQLQSQLDQLNHALADQDREQAKIRLNETIRQREQALEEFRVLEEQIAEQQRAAEDQASRNQAAISQQQQIKWQAEQDTLQTTERIEVLRQEIEAARSRKDGLIAEENALKEKNRQHEQWLRSLELQQLMQRLERMRQRNRLLMESRAALEADLERIMAARGIPSGSIDPSLFQASFQDTEKWIAHYQKLFADTLDCLSGKE